MKISTYILTGGNSTRMGTDKALQLLQGKTFIQLILNALKPIETSIKLVSSKKNHLKLNSTIIDDIEINKGPVSGVVSALKDSKSLWNLVLCCDTPLIQTQFIEWFIANCNTNYDANICIVDDKKMPLTAIYNKNCYPIFKKHLFANQLRVMTVLEDLNVNYIKVPKIFHNSLININTPEQLKAISI